MGTVVLRRRPGRQGLHSLPGREGRRPASRDRSDIGQHANGVGSAVHEGACGALTLDDLISGAWEELDMRETATCPACGGAMALRGGGGALVPTTVPGSAPRGECVDCGAQLS
jgi:hypothetical protein